MPIIKTNTMKRIIILALMSLMLGSCATINKNIRSWNKEAARKGNQVARHRLASTNIGGYPDRNTGARVSASKYSDYCFWVAFGTILLKNTEGPYIEVYGVDPETKDWILRETVHRNGPFADIVTQTDGQRQIISFASGDNGALFVKVFKAVWENGRWKKTLLLRSYTF